MKKNINYFRKGLLLLLVVASFASCKKELQDAPGGKEQNFELSGFDKITAGENFAINVSKGNDFQVKANGASTDLCDLSLTVNQQGELEIKYLRIKLNRDRITINVTLPSLLSIHLNAAARGTITGFQGQKNMMQATLSGRASANLAGTSTSVSIYVTGNSSLILSGNTDDLAGNLSGNAELHAYSLNTLAASLTATGDSKAYITPENELIASVNGNGRIYYRGEPSAHLDIRDNGQVIQE